MNSTTPCCPRLAIVALLACAASIGAHAQQTPITGQMGGSAAPAGVASAPAEPPVSMPTQSAPMADTADTGTHVGSVTRTLLSMQREGTNAGKALSIPGQEASASYRRYLKSFDHPIPEFYETAVSKNSGSSSNSSGMP